SMACASVRRVGPLVGALTIMAGMAVVFPAQPVAGGPATDAVKSSINEVLQILEDKELKKPGRAEERRRKLEQAVGNRFSYEEMAKRSLGAPWKELNEVERKEFVELFQRLLSKSYAGKIEGYSGEQIQYLNERLAEGYAEVRTRIVSGKTEIPLDYRLLQIAGDWRVYDVVVDGVSLVNNYRGQFTKIIRESSYKGLVEQLRKKSEQINSPASQ
ncbi:MAG: MlaC/ttg2D family ABC transporter substrate-binding protein, partial [Nitrospiraceae bacterium]